MKANEARQLAQKMREAKEIANKAEIQRVRKNTFDEILDAIEGFAKKGLFTLQYSSHHLTQSFQITKPAFELAAEDLRQQGYGVTFELKGNGVQLTIKW